MLPTSPWEEEAEDTENGRRTHYFPSFFVPYPQDVSLQQMAISHIPPVTKSYSIEGILPISAEEPSGSLPGPAPSLQYTRAPFVAQRCEGFSWEPEKSEFVGGTR